MLASIPASMVNQNSADLGIPIRFNLSSSRFKEWYERGVRILPRTCLEAVKDPLANMIEVTLPRSSLGHPRPALSGCIQMWSLGKFNEIKQVDARILYATLVSFAASLYSWRIAETQQLSSCRQLW